MKVSRRQFLGQANCAAVSALPVLNTLLNLKLGLHPGMAELGMDDSVVLFTASDFGRTLSSNGRGSDHAWGGNQLVVGGGVQGRRLYGQYPSLAANGPLDVGRGRLIPTTAVDLFFAELALWFGVSKSSLPLVLPNVGRFYGTAGSAPPIGMFA